MIAIRIIAFASFLLTSIGPAAAVLDHSKLTDWKFRAYACRSAILHLNVLYELEQKRGADAISRARDMFTKLIAEKIVTEEKYPFDAVEAEFIADGVFAIRDGFRAGGIEFKPLTISTHGFDLCISVLDSFTRDLEGAGNR